MINFWDVPCTRSDGQPITHYSDVLAQARDCFIQRLDAAISAADYGFAAIQDLPQGIAVSGDLALVMLNPADKRYGVLGFRRDGLVGDYWIPPRLMK
jgi:hypothetical protein